ncbi:4Fe-4S dicluster domain-containing protein [Thermanaerosceptrum fracticalcis]|uniref:4Fe-4S dicluster domain-containing protein n=1 Tax=Thermanaerosceptrum fracticalcis TaxID=1712410 RepID=A0A7G6E2N2_THEFR|nr:4Fe-4S dicluster domain-containing protein [Thermanaerosceptrum fracticalcis]QNB46336.1 4Fe-4S dicluster domain-containing protein [Thermanaerosceptrum fracticalcis]
MKRIIVDATKCAGCRACEVFCSDSHENVVNPGLSRITIINPGTLEEKPIPVVCRQCQEPACGAACPADALKYDPEAQMVVFIKENCVACGNCADACSYGAITLHPETGMPIKCNLCGGDPTCVKHCTAKALTYEEIPDEVLIKKKRFLQK